MSRRATSVGKVAPSIASAAARAAAAKDGHTCDDALLFGRKQRPRLVDNRAHRVVAWIGVSFAQPEKVEATCYFGSDFTGR